MDKEAGKGKTLIRYIERRTLTRYQAERMFYGKHSITKDMLSGYSHISARAFQSFGDLRYIEIPENIIEIGDMAFAMCQNLEEVVLPNSIKKIAAEAFCGCLKLKEINIPDSVEKISHAAFYRCCNLKSIIIPDNVKWIGEDVFGKCIDLEEITLPKELEFIGSYVFEQDSRIKKVIIGENTYRTKPIKEGEYRLNDMWIHTDGNKQLIPVLGKNGGMCKAYKAIGAGMKCRGFKYKVGETFVCEGEIGLCSNGFHACRCFADVFNYYAGRLGEDFNIYEVILDGIPDGISSDDTKIVGGKITIVRKIL